MKAVIYMKSNSTPSRKARNKLVAKNISHVVKNLTRFGITELELRYLLERTTNGFEDLIATRSFAYKEIKDNYQQLSTNELIEYIIKNPTMLKVPIIYTKEHMMVGYDDYEIEQLLNDIEKGRKK